MDPSVRSVQAQLLLMTSALPGVEGEMHRLLMLRGSWHQLASHHRGVVARGAAKRCTQNALAVVEQEGHRVPGLRSEVWCGYIVSPKIPVPIGHCWNAVDDGAVLDSTLDSGDEEHLRYFGIPVPIRIAREIWTRASHGDELLDSWRSACRNPQLDSGVWHWVESMNK